VATGDDREALNEKLTEKQKSRLWEQTRNINFQASRRLEGVDGAAGYPTAEKPWRLATFEGV
jgi:hypothetical protein